ncbi:hypothetical protein [Pseudomonas sp. C11]|uniref:hypothetical protein n=1 Tax=Pseudomonas sp. C11 TaxID=3075550 RepID=UPI002AFFF354|nr:hypothetical protein [Pseudomonas sp. C11]
MVRDHLFEIATKFRKAIESLPFDKKLDGLKEFPIGACGDTAFLLGAYLNDLGIEGFHYVCGTKGSHANNTWLTHAWLQKGDLVIDITADQFTDITTAIVIAERSTWHATFRTDSPTESDFRHRKHGMDGFMSTYKAILWEIKKQQT